MPLENLFSIMLLSSILIKSEFVLLNYSHIVELEKPLVGNLRLMAFHGYIYFSLSKVSQIPVM